LSNEVLMLGNANVYYDYDETVKDKELLSGCVCTV
jgi:hypothetical protein